MQLARKPAAEAIESMGDAGEETGEAIEQKADEVMGTEPTTGEKIEDAANDAADVISDAGDEVKDTVDGQ